MTMSCCTLPLETAQSLGGGTHAVMTGVKLAANCGESNSHDVPVIKLSHSWWSLSVGG